MTTNTNTAVRYIEITTDASAALRDLAKLQDSAQRTERSVSLLTKTVRNLAAGFGAFAGFDVVRRFIVMGDAAANLSQQLEVATGSASGANKAFDLLIESANKAGIGIEEMSASFTRLQVAVPERSLEEVAGSLDLVSEVIAKLGVSTQGANATLIQLIQGLSAGALQGDEFRTVNEQIPVFLRAWADAAGFAGVAVKELSAQGVLTADSFFNLSEAVKANIQAALGLEPPVLTVSRAVNALRNNFIALTRSSTSLSVAFSAIAKSIKFVADNLADLVDSLVFFAGLVGAISLVKFTAGLESVRKSYLGTATAAAAASKVLSGPWAAAVAAASFGIVKFAENLADAREQQERVDFILGKSADSFGAWERIASRAADIELRIADSQDIDLLSRLQAQFVNLSATTKEEIGNLQTLLSYDDQLQREREETEKQLDQLIDAYSAYNRLIEVTRDRTKELQVEQRETAKTTGEVFDILREAREEADYLEQLADIYEDQGEAAAKAYENLRPYAKEIEEFETKLAERLGPENIDTDPEAQKEYIRLLNERSDSAFRAYQQEQRLIDLKEQRKEALKIEQERAVQADRANKIRTSGLTTAELELQALQREEEFLRLGNKERAIAIAQYEVEDRITRLTAKSRIELAKGNQLAAESYQTLIDKWTELRPQIIEQTKTNYEIAESSTVIADTLADSFSDAFETILFDTENWADAMLRIMQNLVADLTRELIANPLREALVGLFRGVDWGSLIGFGGGGASTGGTLAIAGAGAGVQSGGGAPLTFSPSPGAARSMTYGAGAGGGPVTVNVIENPGRGGEQQQRQGRSGETVLDVFVSRIKADMADDIGGGGGLLSGTLERTYGLNRASGAF